MHCALEVSVDLRLDQVAVERQLGVVVHQPSQAAQDLVAHRAIPLALELMLEELERFGRTEAVNRPRKMAPHAAR